MTHDCGPLPTSAIRDAAVKRFNCYYPLIKNDLVGITHKIWTKANQTSASRKTNKEALMEDGKEENR